MTTQRKHPLRVLVTGGAGFIGSHVTERLLERGHSVVVLDDLSIGLESNVPPEAEFQRGSVTNPSALQRSLSGVDTIVHLAAIASVKASMEDPVATHAVNLEGTLHLLESAKASTVTRIIYASSAAVYGNAPERPNAEHHPTNPRSPYAIDKLSGEQYLAVLGPTRGIDVRSLRFFNVFGPRQQPHSEYSGVIGILLANLLHGKPLVLHGDGLQTRDFVFVRDVADIIVRHAEEDHQMPPLPMNVCRGIGTNLLDLVDTMARTIGAPHTVHHEPARLGDVRHSVGDPSRLRAWAPNVTLTPIVDGLRLTAEWLQHQR